VVAVKQFFN